MTEKRPQKLSWSEVPGEIRCASYPGPGLAIAVKGGGTKIRRRSSYSDHSEAKTAFNTKRWIRKKFSEILITLSTFSFRA